MNHAVSDYLQTCKRRVDSVLPELLGPRQSEFALAGDQLTTLYEASHYALAGGGKRVRPALVYAASAACGDSAGITALDRVAAAVEMIHTYSLVHDDLPAMDDDDLRRGRLTVHRAYNEATAILVGDGLQSRAFEVLADIDELPTERRLQMVALLAAAAGPRGMVGGQAIDTAMVDTRLTLQQLEAMHKLKTGALIRAAVALGAVASGASDAQREALDRYANAIGLAFQVQDDVLDVEGDSATLGKTGGKDSAANKPTYVSLLGVSSARNKAHCLLKEALAALDGMANEADRLREIATFIVQRDA